MSILDVKPDFSQFAIKGTIDPTLAAARRATQLVIPTYDGSGMAIHPSVMHFPEGWNGYKYWMAFTPYPSADSTKENPSIVASQDGNVWVVPTGLANPIEPWNGNAGQYYADTHLFMEEDVLYCFWKSVEGGNIERCYYKTSVDGVTWSSRVLAWETLGTVSRPVSPSILRDPDGTYVAYCIEIIGAKRLTRWTAPTLTGPWAVTECNLNGLNTTPWHADFHLINGEYQGLIQTGDSGGGGLVAAVSQDGINFTVGPEFIDRQNGAWDAAYYRSCFVPATQGGVEGWDTWVSSAQFSATGNPTGRTFVSFTPDGKLAREQSAELRELRGRSELMAARAAIAPWVAGDAFSRADNAALGSLDSGQAWVPAIGAFKIAGRTATPTADANNQSVVDTGITDHWATVQINSAFPTTSEHWLVTRWQDTNNFYRCGFTASGNLALQKLVGGALTAITSWILRTKNTGMTIGVRCAGTTISVYVDGVLVGSATDSSLASGTRAGIQANKMVASYRNFTVRSS